MADVQPLRALHYDQDVVGGLAGVVAPPYDVIDAEQRAELAGALAVQRRRRRPSPRRARPLCGGRRAVRELAAAGRAGARRGAGDLGAHPGLHRPRRRRAHASWFLLPRAHRALRRRAGAPARAHAPRPQGGPPAPDARDARQHLTDLLAVLRSAGRVVERAGADDRGDAMGRGARRRWHRPPRLARERCGGDRGRAGGHARRRSC